MKHAEGQLILGALSKGANTKLYQQSWLPDTTPKAVIILVHGYDEHSGRYHYFAEHCVKHGYGVYALDHYGHGKSGGANGFVPAFSVYHDGLDALLKSIPQDQAALPMILVGHSLGGLIAASYLLKNQSCFTAAVLSGPAIKAADEPSAMLKGLSTMLSAVAPKLGVISLDANAISRDPQVVADYLADPLVSGNKISARLGKEMMTTMDMVQARANEIILPMLMLHGSDDSLAAAEGSEFLDQHIGSQKKLLKIYPGLYHEIFNEPEKDMVLADMTDWLDTIIS